MVYLPTSWFIFYGFHVGKYAIHWVSGYIQPTQPFHFFRSTKKNTNINQPNLSPTHTTPLGWPSSYSLRCQHLHFTGATESCGAAWRGLTTEIPKNSAQFSSWQKYSMVFFLWRNAVFVARKGNQKKKVFQAETIQSFSIIQNNMFGLRIQVCPKISGFPQTNLILGDGMFPPSILVWILRVKISCTNLDLERSKLKLNSNIPKWSKSARTS